MWRENPECLSEADLYFYLLNRMSCRQRIGLFLCKIRMDATVLVFPFPYLSHYLRFLVLSRFFQPFYAVRFLGNAEFDFYISREALPTFECETWDAKAILSILGRMDFTWLNTLSIEDIFRSQVEAIKRFRPFLVIGDCQPTLRMASEATSVTYVSVQNGYLSKYYAGSWPISRRHPLYASQCAGKKNDDHYQRNSKYFPIGIREIGVEQSD